MFRKKPSQSKHQNLGNPFRRAFVRPEKRKHPTILLQKAHRDIRWGLIFLWTLFFGTVVYVLLFSSFHLVEDVSVIGSTDIPVERLEEFLRGEISGKYLGVFPKSNFYLVRSGLLMRDLLNTFPKLRSAEVHRIFPNRLVVIVSERDHIVLWCSAGPCYLVGDDGRAADAQFAEHLENEPFLIRVVDESAHLVGIGDPVLDPSFREAVIALKKGFRKELSLSFSSTVFSPSRISDELRFRTDAGWEIMVNTGIPPEKTVATLEALLTKEIDPGKLAKLRYVDLRTEGRAFYSFITEKSNTDEEVPVDAKDDTKEKKKK